MEASTAQAAIKDLSPRELADMLELGEDLQLIDVREEWEWQIARLPGARLIPLGRVDDELATIDRSKDIVLYCKSGVRSLHAAEDPAAAEFTKLANLSGGITRWNHDVDPTVLRY